MPNEHTNVLIVGGGPVGLSTALFLARQGVQPIVVERRPSISQIPRATGLHSRTLELFRMVGLEASIRARGLPLVNVGDMDVEEVRAGRATPLAMYGAASVTALNDSSPLLERHDVQYQDFTPCWPLWCGQDRYEPVLLQDAVAHGAEVRFEADLVSVEQDADGVTAVIDPRNGGATYTIDADYLIGADGVRSSVREAVGIGNHSRGVADYFISIILKADIDVSGKPPFTFLSFANPDVSGLLLFIEPGRWMIGAIYHPELGQSAADFTVERSVEIARAVVGEPKLEVQIESIIPWEAVHMIADDYRSGRVFLAGDAAHCHPPAGGFGVNAGIQDANNLAWKLAAVTNGWAEPSLLDTYQGERRPVGAATAEQAWLLFNTRAKRLNAEELARLSDYIIVAAGYRYSSSAVVGGDAHPEVLPRVLEFTGQPGSIAPHGWLLRDGTRLSTVDLFGGAFVLAAGAGGAGWMHAAERVARGLGVPLRGHLLGTAGDLVDPDARWSTACGIAGGGAVLVRPDGFVAWRSASDPGADPDEVLSTVFAKILGRRVSPLAHTGAAKGE